MIRQRVRLRFRKQGDLRLIGHRDLLRTLERLFRRAGLPLGMSEGFHPKPRLTFPLALAVGIVGLEEVMELELSAPLSAAEVQAALSSYSVPGLEFFDVEVLPVGARKAQVARVVCELPLPADRHAAAAAAAERLLAAESIVVAREGDKPSVDVRPYVERLEIGSHGLRMVLRVSTQGTVRPREVLAALGLADLETEGYVVVRTRVELAPNSMPGDTAARDAAASDCAERSSPARAARAHDASSPSEIGVE